jgi:hypothetical protein
MVSPDFREINTVKDIKLVSAIMHDAQFRDEGFGFNPAEKKFYMNAQEITMQRKFWLLYTRAPIQCGKLYHLELLNVVKYKSNLEKLIPGKSFAGVFNYIKIRKGGKKLTIISQDLRIELELAKLAGNFEEVQHNK